MTTRRLIVHPLATQVPPESLRDGTVVVIDLLRATTTLCYAMAAGASEIIPVVNVDEALQLAAKLRSEHPERYPEDSIRLGGERHCLPIPGFDFGNSPREYTRESVGGRTLIFSTTNGTKAIRIASLARTIFCGAIVNLHSLVRSLQSTDTEEIHLLCAGAGGVFSCDDWWCAGIIVETLQRETYGEFEESETTRRARDAWNQRFGAFRIRGFAQSALIGELRRTVAGRLLVSAGLERDMEDVTRRDHLDVVPRPDPSTGIIRNDNR
ncbi:MAG: 2-phosphosulfolactate phosphatase [Planctomycetia bacterium]|nr:2-phosphosulfolactate phosphatase [Planctomycetia bacterium]